MINPMRCARPLLLMIVLPFYSVLAQTNHVILAKLAGQSQSEVSKALGKPDGCERTKYGQSCSYMKNAIQIVYIGGSADWFTITMRDVLFGRASITSLGFKDAPPTFESRDVIRWDRVFPGILSVSAFPGQNGLVEYFYVKIKTP